MIEACCIHAFGYGSYHRVLSLFSFVYIFQMKSFAPALVIPGVFVILVMFVFSIATALLQQKLSKKQMNLSAKLNGLRSGYLTVCMMNGDRPIMASTFGLLMKSVTKPMDSIYCL